MAAEDVSPVSTSSALGQMRCSSEGIVALSRELVLLVRLTEKSRCLFWLQIVIHD